MHKMMALKITETTYPVAVACLPPAFMFIPLNMVLNRAYLIINQVQFEQKKNWQKKKIEIDNCWTPADLFHKDYEFVATEPKRGQFGEIRYK